MRFQQKTFSCGAAAVVNALRCYGKRVPEKLIRTRAGTNKKDGTQEDHDPKDPSRIGMKETLRSFGFFGNSFEEMTIKDAFKQLDVWIALGCPVVICVQHFEHWVVVVGKLGDDKYIIVDSSRWAYNKQENGIHVMTRKRLTEFWKHYSKKVMSGFAVKMLP
jgi:ABC-type bacteriocin/lantibiotic exporter with double-glycine peptidase domain